MRTGTKSYKLQIMSAILKICHGALHLSMIVAHNEAQELAPALYPFWTSDIKTFTKAGGSHTFMTGNIYHGQVPRKNVKGLVSKKGLLQFSKYGFKLPRN